MAQVPPTADLELLDWSENASTVLSATPTIYGSTSGEATILASLVADYAARLNTARTPATRTKGSIAAKQTSKLALLAKIRQILATVNAYAPVTPQQRVNLGLNPRNVTPTPTPVPGTAPALEVDAQGVLGLKDAGAVRRGRPPLTSGAVVFMKLVAADAPPPASVDDLQFAMIATRGRVALPLPADADAKRLYVAAQWFNERGDRGPVSAIVSKTIAA